MGVGKRFCEKCTIFSRKWGGGLYIFHKNLFTFYSQRKYNLFTMFFLTFPPVSLIIILARGRKTRGENKINRGENKMKKYTFINLAKANVQDICLQWENRNVLEVAWFEDFAIIISK